MYFFKAKPKILEFKPTKKIIYKPEKFNIGRTKIIYYSKDLNAYGTWIYGNVEQAVYVADNVKKLNPDVGQVRVTSGLSNAKYKLLNMYPGAQTLINDIKNITFGVLIEPYRAEIKESEDFYEEYNVAYLEEINE